MSTKPPSHNGLGGSISAQTLEGPNLKAMARSVVEGLMCNGGYAITQMTGLSKHDLMQLAGALARSIDESWRADGGSRRDTWVRRMLKNRLVDVLRSHNSISRTNYTVLTKIWQCQQRLGGQRIAIAEVREHLLADAGAGVTAEKFDNAVAAWRVATASHLSAITARNNPHGRFEKSSPDPGIAARNTCVDDELVEDRSQLVRLIVEAMTTPEASYRYAGFLYLFAGHTMKQAGAAVSLSESRISQVLGRLLPEAIEVAFDVEFAGFDPLDTSVKVPPEVRKTLAVIRSECNAIWAFLPLAVQVALHGELFSERAPVPVIVTALTAEEGAQCAC